MVSAEFLDIPAASLTYRTVHQHVGQRTTRRGPVRGQYVEVSHQALSLRPRSHHRRQESRQSDARKLLPLLLADTTSSTSAASTSRCRRPSPASPRDSSRPRSPCELTTGGQKGTVYRDLDRAFQSRPSDIHLVTLRHAQSRVALKYRVRPQTIAIKLYSCQIWYWRRTAGTTGATPFSQASSGGWRKDFLARLLVRVSALCFL